MNKTKKQRTFTFAGVEIPLYKDCPECGKKNSCEFKRYTYPSRCLNCQTKKNNLEASKSKIKDTFHFSKYKDPVAFGYDKRTGQPLAIDSKGHRFDPSLTRYSLRGDDPKGWKATGKT